MTKPAHQPSELSQMAFFCYLFVFLKKFGLILQFYLFILAVLDLRCCSSFSLVAESGLLPQTQCASFSCGFWALEHKLNGCGAQAQLLHDMWDPLGPEMEPVSPAMASGFFTTEPPGKPISKWVFFPLHFLRLCRLLKLTRLLLSRQLECMCLFMNRNTEAKQYFSQAHVEIVEKTDKVSNLLELD